MGKSFVSITLLVFVIREREGRSYATGKAAGSVALLGLLDRLVDDAQPFAQCSDLMRHRFAVMRNRVDDYCVNG
jgi:hypothetical protein